MYQFIRFLGLTELYNKFPQNNLIAHNAKRSNNSDFSPLTCFWLQNHTFYINIF